MDPYPPTYLCDQALRTQPTRHYLYHQTDWTDAPIALDLGCGAGACTAELAQRAPTLALDINPSLIRHVPQLNHPNIHPILADGNHLPLRGSILSFTLSHFTLMWISDRHHILQELYRVLRPQGSLAAIEPDYSGRIEYPPPSFPSPIVRFLVLRGADPFVGGRLGAELAAAGFADVRVGVLSWEFDVETARVEGEAEAALLDEVGLEWEVPWLVYTPIFWVSGWKT